MRTIANSLISGGSVAHAYLGVGVADSSSGASGVELIQVQADGPAGQAGLAIGDVITTFGGTAVASTQELQTAVDSRSPTRSRSATSATARRGRPRSLTTRPS